MYYDDCTPPSRDERIILGAYGALSLLGLLYLPWQHLWQFAILTFCGVGFTVYAIAPRFWPWLLFQVYRIAVFVITFGCLYYVLHGIFH